MAETNDEHADITGLLAALIEHLPDGVALANLDGTLIYVNPTLQSIIGQRSEHNRHNHSDAAIIGRMTIYDLFTEDEEAEHMMEVVQQIAENDVWHGTLTYRRRQDGKAFRLTVSVLALRNTERHPQALGVLARISRTPGSPPHEHESGEADAS
jgi:PAS domain S-box-containing protein